MRKRAQSSGIALTEFDASIAKGMLLRGDRQHDIASWFGVNSARIAEISSGQTFSHVPVAETKDLPVPGPYPTGREAIAAIQALTQAKRAIVLAEHQIRSSIN